MKKSILTLSAALLVFYSAKAQQSEMAKAIVHYKFSHVRDTTAKDKPYTENMVLFLGQTASVYKSFDKKTQDALMRKQMADQLAEQKGSAHMTFKMTSRVPTTATEYFQFNVQKKLVRKEQLITKYLIEEPLPVINWKISADTMKFGTLLCQKATGHFKGRDYTAWFCPELPFHTGPWKLNGLPGLIVEAYDTNKEVVFKFDGLDEVDPNTTVAIPAEPTPPGAPGMRVIGLGDDTANPNLIAVPADAVRTTPKEYANLEEARNKDPQGFMKSQMAAQGMNFSAPAGAIGGGGSSSPRVDGVRSVSVNVGGGPLNATTINNPLELPEKK